MLVESDVLMTIVVIVYFQYQFEFDETFDESCTNKDIYERTAQPLIKTVFNK